MAFPPLVEHEKSPVESGNREGSFDFKRIFLTYWTDRFAFLTEMFTGGAYGLPMVYSSYWANLRAHSFSIEREVNNPVVIEADPSTLWDPETQALAHHGEAKITISYKPLDPSNQTGDGTFATYKQSQGVEFVDFPGRAMKWETTGKLLPPDVSPVLPILTTRHEVTYNQVTSPPWSAISSLKGKLHSGGFAIPVTGQVIPAGNLLFQDSSSEQTLAYDGTLSTKLTYTFVEKSQTGLGGSSYGWNHHWNPDSNSYDRPVSDGGEPLFASGDLTALFA